MGALDTLLRWPLAGVRAALLVAPLIAAWSTLGAGDPLVLVAVLAMWAWPMSHCLAEASERRRTDDFGVDLLVLGCVGAKTLLALDASNEAPTTDTVWLLPLGLALVHLLLVHIAQLDDDDDDDASASSVRTVVQRYDRRWLGVAFVCVVAPSIGAVLLADDVDVTRIILFAIDGVLSGAVVVALRDWQPDPGGDGAWAGGSVALLTLLALQAVAGGALATTDAERFVRLGGVACAGVATLRAAPTREDGNRVARFVRMLVGLVARVVGTTLPYQLCVLVAGAALFAFAGDAWYTTSVVFPETLRDLAELGLRLVGIAGIFYEFTNDPDFQNTILIALPELAALRGALFRIILQAYPSLLQGKEGAHDVFTPIDSAVALASLVVLFVAWLCVVVQVFPGGGTFVRSPVFWGVGFVASGVSLAAVHTAGDLSVAFWSFVFEDAVLTRTYTRAGRFALAAQLVFCAACLGACLVASERRLQSETQVVVRTGHKLRVGHKLRGGVGEQRNSASASLGRKLCDGARQLATAVTRPSFVIAVVGVFILVLAAMSYGSPVQSYDLRTLSATRARPTWLVATRNDAIGVLPMTSLTKMLGGSEMRLVVLGNALVLYGLEKLGCWGCICLPIPSLSDLQGLGEDIGDAITSFGGLFRRRRLLEHRGDTTHTGRLAVVATMPHRRRLAGLFGNTCTPPPCGGGLTRVCVSDVVTTIVREITELSQKGIALALEYAVRLIIELIPNADFLDDIMSQLDQLDAIAGFALTDMPEVRIGMRPLKMLTAALPDAPSWPRVPTVTVATLLTLLVLALGAFIAYRVGVLMPVARAARRSVELTIVIGVATVLAGALALALGVRKELEVHGKALHVEWYMERVYAYGLGGALLVVALVLSLDEGYSEAQRAKRVR